MFENCKIGSSPPGLNWPGGMKCHQSNVKTLLVNYLDVHGPQTHKRTWPQGGLDLQLNFFYFAFALLLRDESCESAVQHTSAKSGLLCRTTRFQLLIASVSTVAAATISAVNTLPAKDPPRHSRPPFVTDRSGPSAYPRYSTIFSRNLYSEEKSAHMVLTFQLWADEPWWLRGQTCREMNIQVWQ